MGENRSYPALRSILCLVFCLLLLAGCRQGEEPVKESEKGGTFVYYMNMEGTALVRADYTIKEKSAAEAVETMLRVMQEEPKDIGNKSVFPVGVRVRDCVLTDQKLDIHFNSSYGGMKSEEEVLLRAAVVLSLTQITGIEYIEFFVGDEPVKDSMDEMIGYMGADNFLQYTGSSLHLYQPKKLKLYFLNEGGDKLAEEVVNVRYNSNMSMERLIVAQLIRGPSKEGLSPVVPPETKVIGVSVKDTVCYVNLDAGFLNNTYVTDPRLTIYAIVNSIVDGGASSKVQISVNGESNIKYMGNVDLSKPLSRDQDYVQENGK